MLLRSLALFVVFSGSLVLPLAARAEAGEVSGRTPRVVSPGERIDPAGRAIAVDLDRRGAFGRRDLRPVPGVDVRIEGAREVIVRPDGTIEVSFDDEG